MITTLPRHRPPCQLSTVNCQLLRQHFAYATGRLGALETQLLRQTDIDRLLGAPSGKEAVKMLRDIEFLAAPEEGGKRDKGKGIREFQNTLDASTKLVKENVERMVPEHTHFIFDILWLDFDRPRIAYALKESHGFTSPVATPPEPPVSAKFKPTFEQAFRSPRAIDDAIAEACNERALQLAKMSKSYTIYMYVVRMIDIYHTHSVLRSGDGTSGNETIAREREAVESLRESLSDMRRMVLGPEPVFAYAARALNHIALLKVLLTGKVNNLPIQEIKSVLPPLL